MTAFVFASGTFFLIKATQVLIIDDPAKMSYQSGETGLNLLEFFI